MKNKKRLLSLILALCLCMALAAPAWASDTDVLSEFEKENIAGWQQVEDSLDEIHAEIEAYQASSIAPYGVTYGGFTYLDGDIIITPKSSSSSGGSSSLVGHAAIIVGDKVLEIHPDYNNEKPQLVSMANWHSRYNKMMVLRYTANRTIPTDAAWYGKTFYVDGEGRNHTYKLWKLKGVFDDLLSPTNDYCSSLVWKCYYYGADFAFWVYTEQDGEGAYHWPDPVRPYDYINNRAYNGFSAVHSINW